ncbi:MAG: CofH family radical SAM protein, partial [Verrucomicrobiota bacterium]|nr:CofH family radical SAM protein [Verrucomicrobiota bacterium]
MNLIAQKSPLADLHEKVESGERITDDDAMRLFECRDLNALAALANFAREKKVGDRASFIVNRYITYSNYCILSCQFCSFARKKRDDDGFELTTNETVTKAKEALALGVTELHIVGGLHPALPLSYYIDMLKALKSLDAKLHLKCFTAVEILHLGRLSKKSPEEILKELRDSGLDSLTGGGAEIFSSKIRGQIAKGKETAEEWAAIHRAWHRMGGRSTCTMLFGHVENLNDRVDHLRRLRTLQDETNGFTGFIPLPYHPENNAVPVDHPPTGFDILRTIAISRVYLDNVDHLTAYWVGLGLPLAQVALSY